MAAEPLLDWKAFYLARQPDQAARMRFTVAQVK